MYISKLNRKIFFLKEIKKIISLIVYNFIRVYLFPVNRQNYLFYYIKTRYNNLRHKENTL